MGERFVCFATCVQGLEGALHAEIKALRLARSECQVGGVRFEGTLEDVWRANLWLRIANRVLVRLSAFQAGGEDELYRGAAAVDWSRWLAAEGSLVVSSRVRDSALSHSRYVEQRVKDAVVDQLRERFGRRPDVEREDPDLYIHVHLYRDRALLSLDSSGRSLYLRGWRRHQGTAPLSETLAAGMLALSGWDERAPLLDPFAGSGTILIEAAARAARLAPGRLRERFGFERWPEHEGARYDRVRAQASASPASPRAPRCSGRELAPELARAALENAAAAGVLERVEIEAGDGLALPVKSGWNAWIVTNPPYGERVGRGREIEELHRRFATFLRERCEGYHLAILSGSEHLDRCLEPLTSQRIELENGGLACRLWLR